MHCLKLQHETLTDLFSLIIPDMEGLVTLGILPAAHAIVKIDLTQESYVAT